LRDFLIIARADTIYWYSVYDRPSGFVEWGSKFGKGNLSPLMLLDTREAEKRKKDNTAQCITLQNIKSVAALCTRQYVKPGPDYLCHADKTLPSDLRKQWVEPLRHELTLPTAAEADRCPPLVLESVPQRFLPVEFKCLSQTTEDGILLYLLAAIGTQTRRAIEIAGGIGWENNVANLVVNFGFDALFFDGDPGNSRCARNFFRTHTATAARFEQGVWWSSDFVTTDNINEIVTNITGWSGDIDVLSVDIDGVDYWILKALTVVRPRIVVVEIQELWGATVRRTRPYRQDHRSPEIAAMGASLGAFTWLLEQRDYRLVGCMRAGFNAFFVRNDVRQGNIEDIFGSEVYDSNGCFAHVDAAWAKTLETRRAAANKYDWVDPASADQ